MLGTLGRYGAQQAALGQVAAVKEVGAGQETPGRGVSRGENSQCKGSPMRSSRKDMVDGAEGGGRWTCVCRLRKYCEIFVFYSGRDGCL